MHWEEKKNPPKVHTVSSLTSELKMLLENKFPLIWIQGEISNISKPVSGHMYFTLKDSKAQISAVIFRNLIHHLKFSPENGLQITGLARLSVYEPRGTYQLIFEFLEPKGAGALQLAFEQLKARLSQEGLFDAKFKKALPFLPERISVVTSPTGAVIHDIITIVNRRYPSMVLEVVPVKVQGDRAEHEICSAIQMLNSRKKSDLIIVARGGGSLEDLAPFNSENLARAVFASGIPVVSAVGHETDYTICDFVSDLRAPTPSAAAEIVVPVKKDLTAQLSKLNELLSVRMKNHIENLRDTLDRISEKLVDPKRKIIDYRLLIEDYSQRLLRTVQKSILHKRQNLVWRKDLLVMCKPLKKNQEYKNTVLRLRETMINHMKSSIHLKRVFLRELAVKHKALGPMAILDRGYSITRTMPGAEIVRCSEETSPGQDLEIILSHGSLHVGVKGTVKHGKKEF